LVLAPFAFAIELWQHRALLWDFTLRNIELRHKGSHLGVVWALLNPLLMLGLYVLVFGYIFKGKFHALQHETQVDYALGIFVGLTIFHLFAEMLGTAPAVIVSNPNFVKKVVFPLAILPAASVGASVYHMLISMTLALLGVATVGPGLHGNIIWLPAILLPLVLLVLGMAWFFAALGVFFRDINQVIGFLSMALMFASAVFYSASTIPAPAWSFLRFNPVLLAIELARDSVMWNQPISLIRLSYLAGFGFLACIGGYACFRKMAPAFADVL
jgi:lipopolysaccharide transport system permease protein